MQLETVLSKQIAQNIWQVYKPYLEQEIADFNHHYEKTDEDYLWKRVFVNDPTHAEHSLENAVEVIKWSLGKELGEQVEEEIGQMVARLLERNVFMEVV